MYRIRISLAALLIIAATIPSMAQKKKTAAKTKAKTTVPAPPQKTAADLLYENMLPNTQRVFVIDSIVVDKSQFLACIPLQRDNGTIQAYNDFFGTDDQDGQYVFVNGFRNTCFHSEADTTGHVRLFTRDKIAGKWSKPQPLDGLDEFAPDMAYPFMMPDGTTFYFAAKCKESIGGYDLFVTRYDAENARYLRPENIGLPFNSKADDFMYVEDDMNRLAWFVTSRNQPEGKVCVYTIVTSDNRENYDISDIDDTRLNQLAAITRIRDTWPSVAKRNQAMKKLNELKDNNSASSQGEAIYFPINDKVVYRSLSEFHNIESRTLFERMQALKAEVDKENHHLDLIRKEYRNTSGSTHQRLADDIQDYERIIQRQQAELKAMAKQIRNAENQAMN